MGLIAIVIHPPPPPRNNARLISMQTLFKYIRYDMVLYCISFYSLCISQNSFEIKGRPWNASRTVYN